MNLRLVLPVLMVFFFLAAAPSFALEVEGEASLGVFDKYLWRGIDLSEGAAVTQGAVEISAEGFTLGVWANAQLENEGDYDALEVNEVDIDLGYSADVSETVSVYFGNITYALNGYADTNEAYFGVAVDTLLAPEFTLYYDWDEAEDNGIFCSFAVGHTIEANDQVALNLGALVSYNEENDFSVGSYSGWHNYELSASADIAVTEALTITPSLLYSSPLSSAAKDEIDSKWLTGVNLAYAF